MAAITNLWLIFFFSLFVAWVSEKRSVYQYNEIGEKVYVCKDDAFGILKNAILVVKNNGC